MKRDTFGIGRMPWAVRCYLLVFVILWAGLLVSLTVEDGPKDVTSFFMHSLELVLGALIGALSLAFEHALGKQAEGGARGPESTE